METITDDRKNYKVVFDFKTVWILRPDALASAPHTIVTTGQRDRQNKLYKFRPPNETVNNISSQYITIEYKKHEARLWHQRLGHANY